MSRLARYLSIGLVCAVLVGLAPAITRSAAHAQSTAQAGTWYRYQGEPSSYDQYGNQHVNCGPTSVAMAIQYSLGLSVPVKDVRAFIGKNKRYTSHTDLSRALDRWGVKHQNNLVDAQSVRRAVERGNLAVVVV
ncbi:MAG: C39 family peptidase, partial [Chloroflexota bacterium]|nr:C39 family peptidase [Chloroflexota bacterium]